MMRYWIEMALFLHLVFCTVSIYDLLAESNLRRKAGLAMLILVLPVGGILMFRDLKKGRNRSRVRREAGLSLR